MSTESPSKRIRTDSAVRSFERRLSDSSPTSTPLPTVVDSNHDNDTETSDFVLEMTPIVNVHHAPYISTPVLAPIPSVSSTSTAPECPSTNMLPSNVNCSAFQGAHVYMNQPIVANTIYWHKSERVIKISKLSANIFFFFFETLVWLVADLNIQT